MAFTTRTGSYGKQSRLVSFASSERSIDARDARGGDGDAGEDRAGARGGGGERERASERGSRTIAREVRSRCSARAMQ